MLYSVLTFSECYCCRAALLCMYS